MNVALYYASVTCGNGYIYVAGGLSDRDTASNFVEMYDPKKDEWVQLANMNKSRIAFALINSNGILYAMGWNSSIEKYDPWKTCWTVVRVRNSPKALDIQYPK